MHVSEITDRQLNNGTVPIQSQRKNDGRFTSSRESVRVELIASSKTVVGKNRPEELILRSPNSDSNPNRPPLHD